MSDVETREDAMLMQLAELCLDVARDLRDRVLTTKDDAVAAELAQAVHAVARSLRLSLAMKARLERERRRPWTEPQEPGHRETQPDTDDERLVWTERESETESLTEDLEEDFEREDLSAHDLDTHIARTRKRLARYGRSPVEEAAGRRVSPPPVPPPQGEVDRRDAPSRRGLKPTLLSTAAAPLRRSSG
jgi:hypothetical protein